ncbi:hypothetical protein HAX54_022114, partial [Datura stramonium]|nr:hypothetical protein [Datura stramonium]
MDKIYNCIAILDRITKHNQAWHNGDQRGGVNFSGLLLTHLMKENQEREQMMAAMATNLALLTKKFTKNEVKK